MLVPSRCPCEFESRGGRPPPLGSCVPSTGLHLEAEGFGPARISPPPAVTPTRAAVYTDCTGCGEASVEEEERLTSTLQQYLCFSCSSRPSLSCSSLLSSSMWGCSDALAMILSLLRRNATQLATRSPPNGRRIPKTSFVLSDKKQQDAPLVFGDAGQSGTCLRTPGEPRPDFTPASRVLGPFSIRSVYFWTVGHTFGFRAS